MLKTRTMALALSALLVAAAGGVSASADPLVPPASQAQLRWDVPFTFDTDQITSPVTAGVNFVGDSWPTIVPMLWAEQGRDKHLCAELDLECLPDATWKASGTGMLLPCAESPVAPCLDGLSFADDKGKWSEAKLLRAINPASTPASQQRLLQHQNTDPVGSTRIQVQSQWGWKAVAASDVPGSARGALLFEMPGKLNAAGSDTYLLEARYGISVSRTASGGLTSNIYDFHVAVYPVMLIACNNPDLGGAILRKLADGSVELMGTGIGCLLGGIFAEADDAGWAAAFADQNPLSISLRLPEQVGGWFQGRLDDPAVSLESAGKSVSKVVVRGRPVTVPITSRTLPANDPQYEPLFRATQVWPLLERYLASGEHVSTGQVWAPNMGMDYFGLWSPYLDAKARGDAKLWSLSQFNAQTPCMDARSGLQGLVTTNSMVYQASTPTFENGELKYRVGGVHLTSKGDVVQGSYHFIMRKTIAQCLYGFTDAPISGTVAVTSDSGTEQVAVTTVTDRDGWVELAATGFTFSSPVIVGKLHQDAAAPTPMPTPKPTVLKTTIRCTKAGKTKKVTAVKPKCPTGWKRVK